MKYFKIIIAICFRILAKLNMLSITIILFIAMSFSNSPCSNIIHANIIVVNNDLIRLNKGINDGVDSSYYGIVLRNDEYIAFFRIKLLEDNHSVGIIKDKFYDVVKKDLVFLGRTLNEDWTEYESAKRNADNAIINKEYEIAVKYLKEALFVNPNNKRIAIKITKINTIIENIQYEKRQESLKKDFNLSIKSARLSYKNKDYEWCVKEYDNASKIFKLDEHDKSIYNDAVNKLNAYNEHISDALESYAKEDWYGTIYSFWDADSIMVLKQEYQNKLKEAVKRADKYFLEVKFSSKWSVLNFIDCLEERTKRKYETETFAHYGIFGDVFTIYIIGDSKNKSYLGVHAIELLNLSDSVTKCFDSAKSGEVVRATNYLWDKIIKQRKERKRKK